MFVLLALLAAASTRSHTLPAYQPKPVPAAFTHTVELEVVLTGIKEPVGIEFAPGDAKRMFVVERFGKILVAENGAVSPNPFLDLGDRISTNHQERGLLGLAFHPHYADNGRFYVAFTDPEGKPTVAEFTMDSQRPGLVNLKSQKILLNLDHPFKNHNGGRLAFGPDGKLWIGTGDGGSGGDPHGNGQNPDSHLAKMLRIDVDAPDAKVETWGSGLRNPWRYSFDRKTGDLYIADVGQDMWEEVDVVPAGTPAGLNFGWNVMEGTHCFHGLTCKPDGLTLPVMEYGHADGCSITGGYVYRGRALPALDGLYFYADYCTGMVRSFRWKGGTAFGDGWEWRPVLDPSEKLAKLSTFGEDGEGELYLASLDGTIWKFVPVAAAAKKP